MRNFRKSDNSLSWLQDGSGLVFEAENNAAKGSRVLVRYDLRSQQVTPLTSTSDRSTEPQVTNDTIAFWRFDLSANSNSAWRWHSMTVDGQNDTDLGLDVGVFGAAKDGKLYAMTDKKLIEVTLASKQQKVVATDLPFTSTASRAAILEDNKLVAPYQSDPNSPAAFNRLGFVDLSTGTFTSVDKEGASEPFQTALLSGK